MFCVTYYPETDSPRMECAKKQDELYIALEYVTAGGSVLRGTKRSGEYTDGFLNFFVSYNLIVKTSEDITLMKELEINNVSMEE